MSDVTRGAYQHPACGEDPTVCRITVRHWMEAPQEYVPQFDGTGAIISADPNTAINELTCSTCARVWQHVTSGGETTLRLTPSPPPPDL